MNRNRAKNNYSHGLHIGSDYSDEELIFLRAIDRYCCKVGRRVLTPKEILLVARSAGFIKIASSIEKKDESGL